MALLKVVCLFFDGLIFHFRTKPREQFACGHRSGSLETRELATVPPAAQLNSRARPVKDVLDVFNCDHFAVLLMGR